MKKGKKAIAFLLALCMTLSLSVTGFAADAESEPTVIDEEAEGTLGSVHWKLAGSVMTIYGDGSMGGTTSAGTYTNNKSPIYDYRESVTEVIIEYGVTDVSGYVFSSFSNLTKVTIPGSVTEIGNGAFYNCTSLTEIEIPQSVTSIGQSTFNGCSSLKNITIPAGVTSIGSNAFQNSGATEITFMGDPPTMNNLTLTGVTGVGYYPAALSGWTNSVLSSTYGGSFTWTPMTVEGAYKGALEQAVFVAGEKTENQYSEDSWTAMQQALSTAEAVDGDTNAAQDAVNEAEMALRSAISMLDPKMTVQISSEADLRGILRDTEDYTKNDTLAIELVGDITLTESVTDLRNPAVISIDGKKYSLNGSGSNAMIAPLMASYWQTAGITLQDLVVDAKDQQFFVGYNINNSGDFTLNKVEMKNVRGSGTGGNAGISLYTGSGLTNVTLNDITTEGCAGVLLYLGRCNVQVTDCTLISSSYLDSEGTVQGRLIYLGNGNSSNWNDLTLTDSSLTVDDPEECGASSILYMDTYSRAALNGCGINGVESSYMIYTTGNSLSNKNSLTIQDTVFSNLDETTAEIYENDANTDLTIYGDVKGDFVVRLGGSTPTGITLGSALQQDLKFYYGSSILGTDPIVAKGSTEHPLDEGDLEKLVYTETNPLRSVKMTSESGEADICRLYRTDMADCDVALDATGAEGTYDGKNGNGPVFLRNENNGALEPDVIVTLDGKVLSAGNYTVEYNGTTKVPEGSEAEDILDAWATVKPTGDLTGDSETLPYYIEVKMLYELTADNTKTVLTYEDGKYGTEVTYYGQNNTEGIDLTEDEDYTAVYRVDEDSYTVTVTVTGIGDYAGSYEATFDLP
ncbi:MAG: leucine-rich repeat domain-containing protein, partial [Clostridia bacterium]|nr:leucine-rich repeat domain-containing protein [Clostridia bacterium]